nr:MAG: putative RNA-dependent RNA polymerase [Picobirnavirus sp.]
MWRTALLASQGALNRLFRWFSRMAAGSTVDLRTPFFAVRVKGKLQNVPQDTIVQRFQPILKAQLAKEGILGRALIDWEQEHAERVGPMSMFKPWRADGPDKAKAVFSDKPMLAELDSDAMDRAELRLASLVRAQSVELISLQDAIDGVGDDPESGMDTGTNSGLPYVIRPWKDTAENDTGVFGPSESKLCFEYVVDRVQKLTPVLTEKTWPVTRLPYWHAVSGQRLVQKGIKPYSPKSKRLVIAMPKEEAVLGKRLTVGVMAALKKATIGGVPIMSAWNPLWYVDEQLQVMLRAAHEAGQALLSGDISNFDATVPPWLLQRIGRTVAKWVRGGEHYVTNLFNMMIYRTILWTPTGSYGPGPSSMKSGSALTSLGGSLANILIQFYGEELGLYKIRHLVVLGDDFVIGGDGVSPENTSTVFSHVGMEANPTKQYYEPKFAQFLQRLHVLGRIGGIASAMRTLGSVLSLEKLAVKSKEWNKFAYVVQALSKIQNATFHPAFKQLVDFIASGDELHLGSNMSPTDLVSAAGPAAEKIMGEQARQVWKQLGSGVGFKDWTVNGVLRKETLPSDFNAFFTRVYGRTPFAGG